MSELGDLVSLADQVSSVARERGIETALIGAAALAAYGYVRATEDIDLGTAVFDLFELHSLTAVLRERGLNASLRTPDDEDQLGGVIRVWTTETDDGEPFEPVEIVNFFNPHRPRHNPGAEAIRTAEVFSSAMRLRLVRLPNLIALKLDTGAPKDFGDAVELLKRNPTVDVGELRALAERYRLTSELEAALAAAPSVTGA